MTRYEAGQQVAGGYYWNVKGWDIQTVSGEQGQLEGEEGAYFFKLPLVAMVPLAAAMSFAFVIFLPFIGFAMLVYALVRPVARFGYSLMHSTARTLAPDLQPGAAYLAGKPREGQEAKPGSGEGLRQLEDEVSAARRRQQEHK